MQDLPTDPDAHDEAANAEIKAMNSHLDGPNIDEIVEFGDPSKNAKVEILPSELLHNDPNEDLDDEVADGGDEPSE